MRFGPPKPAADGTMPLVDHIREFRYRFLVSLGAVVAVTVVALFFEEHLIKAVLWPIQRAVALYQQSRPGAQVEMVTQGVTSAFALYFKVCFTAGIIGACPVWLYQLWRFVAPALHRGERRIVTRFLLAAIPLFLFGVAAGYVICPRGFSVLLAFNPPSVMNLNDIGEFMTFELRLLLVFGCAFLLPVVLVMLNRIGVVKAEALARFRGVAVVGCALFSAIATPTTDAITMLALALPMVAMYLVAEVICHAHDKRAASGPAPETDKT
jgi:sec-independent protein translocase protein TatC